jgi:phage portal protein, HK97 family
LASDAEANAQGFFRGGANVAGILKSSSPMTSKQKEGLKQSWNSAFNGVTGTPNGVAVLDADLSFQAVQINPADSQLLETRAFNVVDICRFFGVSPVKAFDLSKSSYNTIEQMQLAFLTDTLQPLIEKFEEEFKRKIFKPSEIDNIDVRFSTAPLLRADKQSLAQYYSTLFQIGVITPNEIRKELDFGELADGNESFVQVNVQSLKKAMRNEEEEGDTNDNK